MLYDRGQNPLSKLHTKKSAGKGNENYKKKSLIGLHRKNRKRVICTVEMETLLNTRMAIVGDAFSLLHGE